MAQNITVQKKQLESIFDQKLKPISDSIGEMNESMKFLNSSFEEIKSKVGSLEDNLNKVVKDNRFLQQETLRLSDENKKLSNLANGLSKELNDIQQYLRRDCCEITGIPPVQNESTDEIVIKIALLMGLNLNVKEISVSHRLPTRGKSYSSRLRLATRSSGRNVDPALQYPRIIVKFVRRETKDLFYRSRKMLVGKTTKDLGLSRISDNKIYVSESITAKNKELFKECLKFRRKNDFKYIWTNQGRIYLRQNKDSPSKAITSQADLER